MRNGRRLLACIPGSLLLLACVAAHAGASKVIFAEATYVMADGDTLSAAEENTLLRAKRKAIEEAGVYIESSFYDREKHSGGNTSQVSAREIRTISAAIAETEVLEMHRSFENDRPLFHVKIRSVVNMDKLEETVKRLRSEEHLATHYHQLQKENQQLKIQLKELRRQPQVGTTLFIEPTQTTRNRERATHLVQAAMQAQSLTGKIELASQAAAADDRQIDAYIVRGQTFLRIASLTFAHPSNPDEFSKYLNQARNDFDQALHLDPANTWALLGRADTLTWHKKSEEAARDYEQILHLDPLFDIARQRLITLYTTLARQQVAAKQWKQALATLGNLLGTEAPDSWVAYQKEAYLLRGEVYSKLNQPQRAIDDLSTVIRVDPTNAHAFELRARLYQDQMQGRPAKDDLERACVLGSGTACAKLP